jgi:hypothetical protein
VEEASASLTGELPTTADQGEQQYPPSRSQGESWFGFSRRGEDGRRGS